MLWEEEEIGKVDEWKNGLCEKGGGKKATAFYIFFFFFFPYLFLSFFLAFMGSLFSVSHVL